MTAQEESEFKKGATVIYSRHFLRTISEPEGSRLWKTQGKVVRSEWPVVEVSWDLESIGTHNVPVYCLEVVG